MSEKIMVYAPCDGEIISLNNLNDATFSNEILGTGFAIKPNSNDFYNLFELSYIKEINPKKHAFKLKVNDIILFIHIGLESYKLKKELFNYIKKNGELLKKDEKILSINWEQFPELNQENKVIPIILERENDGGYSIQNLKTGNVKKGDVICELTLNIKNQLNQFQDIVNKRDKYGEAVESIFKLVGTNLNFSKYYNCVTRFRIVIKDKDLVKESEIKKIPIVKGIRWNGNEIQIIIGGEVYKVRDAFDEFMKQHNNSTKSVVKESNLNVKAKQSFKDKLLAAVTGIIIPALPVIMAAGILKAIQAILTQTGVLQTVNLGTGVGQLPNITDYNLGTCLVYIIAEAGLSFMGIYFCYNTVKFLGGNQVMGIFVGVALVCPFLYSNGSWASFELFKIGQTSIAIKGYQSSIIPQICAGLAFYYIDKWAQKWIPASVDIVLRPAFSFMSTMLVSFLIVGPIMGIVESGVFAGVTVLNDIPYGIGVGIFTLLWQPLVLTGMHYPIIMPIMLDQAANDTTSTILVGTTIGVLGQAGAAVAVVLRTKSAQTKSIGIGSLTPAFFGVTEPAIYGVNLPKFWPFVWGCVGAGIAGFVSGLLNVVSYQGATPSMGLIFVVGFVRGGWQNVTLGCLVLVLGAIFSFVFVIFTYKDREDEVKSIRKLNKTVSKIFYKKTNLSINSDYQEELDSILKFFTKENKEFIKKVENNFSAIEKLEVKIELLSSKENNAKAAIILKMKKAINKEDLRTLNILKEKHDSISYQVKINDLILQKNKFEYERNIFISQLDELQENILSQTNLILEKIAKNINYENLKYLQNNYYNAVHSVDIAYGLSDKKENQITRKDINRITS